MAGTENNSGTPLVPVTKVEWDMSSLGFANDTDPRIAEEREAMQAAAKKFAATWGIRVSSFIDPDVLSQALDAYDQFKTTYGGGADGRYYFELRTEQDTEDPTVKAEKENSKQARIATDNIVYFFPLAISRIPRRVHQTLREHPGLAPYSHYLERRWAEKPHVLSKNVQKVVEELTPSANDDWVDLTQDALAGERRLATTEDGQLKMQTLPELASLLYSPDKAVRDSAVVGINRIVKKHLDKAIPEVNAILRTKRVTDKLRHYARPDAERHFNDDIDSEVVDSMLDAVASRFDIPQRYYRLKAALLGLPQLDCHDRYATYGDFHEEYSFQRSVDLVYSVFNKIDPTFGDIFAGFVTNGQIDSYPRLNKADGAFCAADRRTSPIFIFLNHTNRLSDVLTVAHEGGHGINNELMRGQNELNYATSTATAEVASTFFEDFVFDHLFETANDEERLTLSMMQMDNMVGSIFQQVAGYRFEKDLHAAAAEKGKLTEKEIGELYRKNMTAMIGDSVRMPKEANNWWVRWPHIRDFFYMYSYASGMLIAKSLQQSVKEDPAFIDKFKEFLAAGTSDSPKNIFSSLGVDITDPTFWEKGLSEVDRMLTQTEELARRLGKLPSEGTMTETIPVFPIPSSPQVRTISRF